MIKKSKENIATNLEFKMLSGSLLSLIQGLVPGIFEADASNNIKELYEFINKKRI